MTLDACPSPAAAEWREEIQDWVAEGVPVDEIRHRLQARVPGFELRIAPAKSGWVIPVLAVVLPSAWLFLLAWRFRVRARRRAAPVAVGNDATGDARLDDELAQLDD